MAALQYVDQPGYSAILLRRTYADLALAGALMDRADEWLRGTDARWNGTSKVWMFPSGATLQFGYLDNEAAKYRYQSAEFQFIGFDELTQFSERQYTYLFSRLRRLEGTPIPLRMRAASNPGGGGHEWVRQRFIAGDEMERVFIPARLTDNPFLDQDQYVASLNELDPVTRQQLLHGDWEVRVEGNMFRREWLAVIEAQEVPDDVEEVRYWDLAATRQRPSADPDFTVGVKLGRSASSGLFYVLDVRRGQYDPPEVEALVMRTAAEDGTACRIGIEREGGSAGKIAAMDWQRKLLGYALTNQPATGDKAERARPLSAACANGLVRVVRGAWNGAFFDELECFPNVGVHDDQVDAASGAFGMFVKRRSRVLQVVH